MASRGAELTESFKAFEAVKLIPNFTNITDLSLQHGVICVICTILIVHASIGFYRLYLSPLSRFPGDKLAAASGWVETYHDVFRGGQFIFKIQEWHAKYGPIVRINPWEVHISDPDFIDVIFASNSQFDKKVEWKYRFGIPNATFDTIEHDLHRARRSALGPFFSRQKINAITGFITEKAQELCDRLENEYKDTGRPANLNNCFTAFTFDIITYYTFARCFDYLRHPTFQGPFTNAAKELAKTLHTMGHFPWLRAFLQSLPTSWARAMNPTMGAVFDFHGEIESQIRSIKSGDNKSHNDVQHKTVFHELLNSDLPKEEKAIERLRHEGGSVVAGGVETTATALSKAFFFILENSHVKAKILEELDQGSIFSDPRVAPSLSTLEALPYLSAVVNETLRMTIGISSRTIRKSTRGPVRYKDKIIPQGAYFSMTTYFTHYDAEIWDEPLEFRPERWLGKSPISKGTRQSLSKYLVGFGRGPRMCVGMNLARAELFLGLAIVLRRCNFELFETTRAAVEMKADYFIPFSDPKVDGVKVLVK